MHKQAFTRAFAVGHGLAVGVAVNGKLGFAPHCLAQQGGKFLVGFGHHGAVKRTADLELKPTALAFLGLLAGQGHGGLGAADNKLAGGVVVGHQQQLAALGDGFGHNFFNGWLVELEQGGHATLAFGVGLGHEAATQGGELKGAFG